jgi:hypothetical protein
MPSLDDDSWTKLSLTISKVHEHFAALRRLRNSLVSPLCRMPYEIIVKIVSLIPDPYEEDEHASLLLAKSGPICHHIWSILKDTPKFWGHVDFNQPDSVTFLFRCRGRPTRLWIRYSPSEARNSWTTETMNLWLSLPTFSLDSLEEFRFYGNQNDFDNFQWIFAYHLPRLRNITIVSGRIQYSWVPEIIETWTISGQLPTSLNSITLKQVYIPWENVFTCHLVNLDLDYSQTSEWAPISMSSFLELLSLCTRLETLRLCCAGPETQDRDLAHLPSTGPVHLTKLRTFEISDDALNIAYIMNNLKLPDTTQTFIEPSIDWPVGLVGLSFPSTTRIYPTGGLIKWYLGHESTLTMGNTEFTYYMDADDDQFMEAFRQTFERPLIEFAAYSTSILTVLELDFDLEFEPDQDIWFTVLSNLPALRRLSCASSGPMSLDFAPNFFAELGRGTHGEIHCQKLEELDLSFFDLFDLGLKLGIFRCLKERHNAGFLLRKFLFNKSFEISGFDQCKRTSIAVDFPDDEAPV